MAVPVVVGGQHVATLFGGQALCQEATRHSFARVAKLLLRWKSGPDLSRVRRAYFRTRVIPEKEFRALLHLLHAFAQLLAELAPYWMIAIRRDDPPWLAQAKGHINGHAAERLTMRRVASLAGLSPYHFCRLFHKTTGMTYTEYVSRVRVEKAKHLLFDPSLHVTDVAFDSGFQSLPHFERIFKRHTGLTPNAYRAAQRQQQP